MANKKIRSIDFLPSTFRSNTNRKFLGSTIDQLISQPNFKKVDGFVGRRFAPTFKSTDNYVPEPNDSRKNYQLEPSLTVLDDNGNRAFKGNYVDYLQQISYYGGDSSNHDRLFANEFYNYDGLFDFDKFVNFSQYYWIPEGLAPVSVSAGSNVNDFTYTVKRNTETNSYEFTGHSTDSNPMLIFNRGGVYKFEVNQPGNPFWIQTETGLSGVMDDKPTMSTREILGVTNNGIDVGTVTVQVQLENVQDFYTSMIVGGSVDMACPLSFNQLANKKLSSIVQLFGGIDGTISDLDGKTLIFTSPDYQDYFWTVETGTTPYGNIIPQELRYGTWTLRLIDDGNGDFDINLLHNIDILLSQRVEIRYGNKYSGREFYKDGYGYYKLVPVITAPLNYLTYQDGNNSLMNGKLKLVDPVNSTINVDDDIVGNTVFTSANGVRFTNGLHVDFDNTVYPESYQNKTYYVEGVGESIRLIDSSLLITPESELDISQQDYITINRSSNDLNQWSRFNRWFHVGVIGYTDKINNTDTDLNLYKRASRAIIEFDPDMQLFNSGSKFYDSINIIDFDVLDPFETIQNSPSFLLDGIELQDGMHVLFASATDPLVRNYTYVVSIEDINGTQKIILTKSNTTSAASGDIVVSMVGNHSGIQYHYDGEAWVVSQQKTSVNQEPLYDVFDDNNLSFSDSYYVNSSFRGTKIFSYKKGTGSNDTVLGFPLSYRTMQSVGDIQFTNDFDTDIVTHTVNKLTETFKVNTGKLAINTNGGLTFRNIWTKSKYKSRQYQVISHIFDNITNYFEIDIVPEYTTDMPTLKVYVGGVLVDSSKYNVVEVGARKAVVIDSNILTESVAVDIAIYNKTDITKLGHYDIPLNFGTNAENAIFETLTLGQLRNHLMTLSNNSVRIVGDMPGDSNLRDINVKSQCGSIMQHSAPAIYGNLFLTDEKFNFMNSCNLARREFTRFKNRFIELSTSLEGIDLSDIPSSTDLIIKKINEVKTANSQWYYSDMIPWGDNKTVLPTYKIVNTRDRQYQISEIFDDSKLSNKAVLVYLNKKLLTKDVDYSFNKVNAAVIINDMVTLNYGDAITIVEYSTTDGNFVPETPTKLGLYPKFQPMKMLDETYVTPVYMIRGHDGSMTPSYGDFRDDLLLELENRIYNNIKSQYDNNLFNLYDHIPGRFRTSEYSLAEFNRIVTKSFLNWVGTNKLDYISNTGFDSNNPWTWNFKKFIDVIDGTRLNGSWRAVFNYYYDTDRPNTHPWEMLGFSNKPDWWENRYGPAPYTGGNQLLWEDLRDGYIHDGDRKGYDERFARYGLMSVIPVDDAGNLISPESFVKEFSSTAASSDFSIGEFGPVETAWRKSSEYPYAIQMAMAVMYPSIYFGSLMNTENYYRDTSIDQLVQEVNGQRITPENIKVNGLIVNDQTVRTAGYLNWVVDYVTYLGFTNSAQSLVDILNSIEMRLAYKVAGFTDKNYLTIFAEQSSPTSYNNGIILPSENYNISLYKSTPVDKAVYSAVIVDKGNTGYTVSGYDLSNPYFTVIPSIQNSNAYSIKTENSSGTVYNDYRKVKVNIPYGHEFKTKQQVVDFLVSYQRYLQSVGFVFNVYNENIQTQQDWILSAKEFLTWADQGWKQGNIIVLSPINDELNFYSPDAVVDEILNKPEGSKVRGTTFDIIKSNKFTVLREDNNFRLNSNVGQTIAYAELNLVQYEHVIVFDNITVFSDVVYQPELGNRQYRMKIVGNKTGDWSGALNPAGFIYNSPNIQIWAAGKDYKKGTLVSYKNLYWTALLDMTATDVFSPSQWQQTSKDKIQTGLLPNFSYNAQKFENFYDIDNQPQDRKFDFYSNGIIGFRPRQYLTDLGIDITTQSKFYQGYIRDKGTMQSIDALTSSKFSNISSNIVIGEEWAFRVGEYGALGINESIEIPLVEGVVTSDPITVQLLESGKTADSGAIGYLNKDLYRSPEQYRSNIFANRTIDSDQSNDIKTAGYVHREDVDFTIFDIRNYSELNSVIDRVGSGTYVWVAKDFDNDWNVYRVSESNNHVVEISYSLDNFVRITTNLPHGMLEGDVFSFRGFGNPYDSFYQVYTVEGINDVIVYSLASSTMLQNLNSVTGTAVLYKMHSARLNTIDEISDKIPLNGWKDGDKIWCDNIDSKWEVFEKSSPFEFVDSLVASTSVYTENGNYGHTVAVSSSGTFVLVGGPNVRDGIARLYVRSNDTFVDYGSLQYLRDDVKEYGYHVVASKNSGLVTAPGSIDSSGMVFVYLLVGGLANRDIKNIVQQVLRPSGITTGSRFGESISISQDDRWVYIGAPGQGKVYVYGLRYANDMEHIILTDGSETEYTLSFVPISGESLTVISDKIYIPELDYSIDGNVLTFVDPPPVGSITVTQSSYYSLCDVIDVGSIASDKFGSFVHTNYDGSRVAVSAPRENDTGYVYMFDRSSEQFISNGVISSFTTSRDMKDVYRVTVNGYEKFEGIDYVKTDNTITFNAVLSRSSIVVIETNYSNLLQKLSSPRDVTYSEFGYSIDLSADGDDIVISSPFYSETNYHSGLVHSFTNNMSLYGFVEGNIQNPVVNYGDSIRINGHSVVFNGTTLESCVENINSANIPGVEATSIDGRIRITANWINSTNKLSILPNVGTAIADLGIETYTVTQELKHPYDGQSDRFGTTVKLNESAKTLLISSEGSTMKSVTVLDSKETTFDNETTAFLDSTENSGTVMVYDRLDGSNSIGKYVFSQELFTDENEDGMRFGESLDIKGEFLIVGTPGDPKFGVNNSGDVYLYRNSSGNSGWETIRVENDKVDPESLVRGFVFDADNQNIIASLGCIDPAKGKILGAADQDIDYRTEYDPAIYNVGLRGDVTNNDNYYWSSRYIGKTWWKLSDVRYLDYEQGDIVYRTKNWGKMFEGSKITVLEWVESNVPPSMYTTEYENNGTPLYEDDSAYVVNTIVDQTTNNTKSTYYFWVYDRNLIDTTARSTSIVNLESMIEFPELQGIPYISIIRNDTINVHGVNTLLNADKTVLHIDYQNIDSTNLIHAEYQLVSEKTDSILPDKIVDKMVDSFSGIDRIGQLVPDPFLLPADQLGISIRPRQTVVKNRNKAVESLVLYVNSIFKLTPISETFDLSKLKLKSEIPTTGYDIVVASEIQLHYIDTTDLTAGYKVLVESDLDHNSGWSVYMLTETGTWDIIMVQSYNTMDYWKYIDWVSSDFVVTTKPTYTVDMYYDVYKLSLNVGDIVRVNNNGQNKYATYRVASGNKMELVVLQNGTIELSSLLYDYSNNLVGFDNSNFDVVGFDYNNSKELRNILNAMKDDIFVDSLKDEATNLFFVMMNYILSEQRTIDWAFKTSFINVVHKLRKLIQHPIYVQDNQSYFEDFINEVKPYRTTIREYKIGYQGDDIVNGNVTDFDLPSYYDKNLDIFRSPNGEMSYDASYLQNNPEYKYWYNNYKYSVESIIVEDGGDGYSIPPVIIISGGNGSGVVTNAIIDPETEKLIRVDVLAAGYGYDSIPTATVVGNGTGAKLYVKLKKTPVRTFTEKLRFDRISYDSEVIQWESGLDITAGATVAYNNTPYEVLEDIYGDISFESEKFREMSASELKTANDRIMVYYQPSLGMPSRDLRSLIKGVEYPGVIIDGQTFTDSEYLDAIIESKFGDNSLGVRPEDIIIDGGAFIDKYASHAPEELVPGMVQDSLCITVLTKINGGSTTLGFRMFTDMSGARSYHRIASDATTKLTQNLNVTDTVIHVEDVTVLGTPSVEKNRPGVIFIGNEKITYYTVDIENNTLNQIRRGVDGTAINMTLQIDTSVVDASDNQKIQDADYETWLNVGTTTIADGTGFEGSNTRQVRFLKASPN